MNTIFFFFEPWFLFYIGAIYGMGKLYTTHHGRKNIIYMYEMWLENMVNIYILKNLLQ